MSYLAGPLTRQQVAKLMAGHEGAAPPAVGTPPAPRAPEAADHAPAVEPGQVPAEVPDGGDDTTPVVPAVAEGIPVRYLHPSAPWAAEAGADVSSTTLRPALAVRVRLTYDETRGDILEHQLWEAVVPISEGADIAAAVHVDYDDRDLTDTAPAGATYLMTAAPLDTKTFYSKASTELVDHLYRTRTLVVPRNAELKLYGRPGETPAEFAARCDAAAQDRADEETGKLRTKYRAKLAAARERFEKAESRAAQLEADVSESRQDEVMGGAGTLIDILTGRASTRAASQAARRRSATRQREARLETAKQTALSEADAIADLDAELAAEVEEIDRRWAEVAERVDQVEVGLEKSDIHVDQMALVWIPAQRVA
jgi:hypothetical protein